MARSVSGALGGLALASTALALLLSQTSARFAWNLPVAVAVVWATHALARVRVDARWDTRTRCVRVSVTRLGARYAPGTPDDASGASRAFSRRDADVAPLAGETRDAASERERTCFSARSSELPLVDAMNGTAATGPATKNRDGSQTAACSSAFPLRARTRREAELRDALRARETVWRDAGSRSASAHMCAEDARTTPPDPSEPGLLGSWAKLRDRVVREFVTDLWYAPITPDAQFPNAVSRVLDVAFAELAHRARRADLAELLLETAPVILADNLERFRSARDVVGGVDAYVRRTPREADAAMAPTLWPRELFGEASLEDVRAASRAPEENEEALLRSPSPVSRGGLHDPPATATAASPEPSPLIAAFGKHASRVLSARCVAVADALLRETVLSSERAPDPLLRPLARELLVGCLLRPLLGFFSPAWAHRGLAALLAAEDDIAAARGGEAQADRDGAPRDARVRGGSDGARGRGTFPTFLTAASASGGSAEVSDDDDDAERLAPCVSFGASERARSARVTEPTSTSRAEGDAEDSLDPENFAGAEARRAPSEDASVERVVVAARVAEAHIAGKGASAYAVYAVRVRARTRANADAAETEKEWVVPRRFRNFEALHRRCEKEASDSRLAATRRAPSDGEREIAAKPERAADDVSDAPFAPLPALPKKRFVINSLDGAFVEARRALLDQYLVALTSCPARAARSAATRAFLDPATVAGPFAPEPDTGNAPGSFFATHARRNSFSSGSATNAPEVDAFVGASWMDDAGGDDWATANGDIRDGAAVAARGKSRRGAESARRGERRPPVAPGAESFRAGTSVATSLPVSCEVQTPLVPSHRRRASSGAIPSRAFAAGSLRAGETEGEKNGAATESESKLPARRSFPDLASASSGSSETRASPAEPVPDASEVTALDSLARGGLLRLFESVFHLRAKGVVRRTIVAAARQTLEFFAGAAVEDLAAAKLRALRSPETAKAAVDLIERALWPGGVWHGTARARDPAGGGPDVSAPSEEERVRLKVRDALLASWSRGPLYNLVGARNCTRAGLDVLGAARSELLCARVGLEATLAALDAAFPESAV